jgi:hypothetical protein
MELGIGRCKLDRFLEIRQKIVKSVGIIANLVYLALIGATVAPLVDHVVSGRA